MQERERAVLRRFGMVGLVICAVVVVGGPAWAHVSITPDSAPKGSFTVLSFNVPNEEATAKTTEVAIVFPTDHPIGDASVEAIPGWTVKVDKKQLDKPIQTDEGEVTEAVSQVTWSGGTIEPERFQQFTVEVGLPDDADSLEFKALQTYDDGTVVRWIEPTPASGAEPEFPAPVLTLTERRRRDDADDGRDLADDDGYRGIEGRGQEGRRRLRQDPRHRRRHRRCCRSDRGDRCGRARAPTATRQGN